MKGRKYDQGYCRITPSQVCKDGKTIPVWQIEVEQDQMKIGMRFNQLHRLMRIGRLHHGRVVDQVLKNATQRGAN